jgi:hypothetical protein
MNSLAGTSLHGHEPGARAERSIGARLRTAQHARGACGALTAAEEYEVWEKIRRQRQTSAPSGIAEARGIVASIAAQENRPECQGMNERRSMAGQSLWGPMLAVDFDRKVAAA